MDPVNNNSSNQHISDNTLSSQCPNRTGPRPLCLVIEAAKQKEGLNREPGALASRPGSVVDQLCALDQVTLGHWLLISEMGSSRFHKMILSEANGAFRSLWLGVCPASCVVVFLIPS